MLKHIRKYILALIALVSLFSMSAKAQIGIDRQTCHNEPNMFSSAIGESTTASANDAFAGGKSCLASGAQSFAFGLQDTACAPWSFVIGKMSVAKGEYSLAGGYKAQAVGQGTIALGFQSYAGRKHAVALGYNTTALELLSVSIGSNVHTEKYGSITIGSGINDDNALTNKEDGIMLGMNSVNPTLFITRSDNDGKDNLYNTGKVGIGAAVPEAKFHIISDPHETAGMIIQSTNQSTDSAYIQIQDREHFLSVGADRKMRFSAGNNKVIFDADAYCFGSERIFMKNEGTDDFSVFVPKTMSMEALQIRFSGNDAINMNSQRITMNGKVGINIENYQDDYSLAVNGGIITTEVYIAEADNWPDHVFADDYKLMGLHELENFIRANRHLPEVPSEEEVLENGYDMGEMQQTLLKKIEELTLYTIQLQQQIERQQKEIDELKAK